MPTRHAETTRRPIASRLAWRRRGRFGFLSGLRWLIVEVIIVGRITKSNTLDGNIRAVSYSYLLLQRSLYFRSRESGVAFCLATSGGTNCIHRRCHSPLCTALKEPHFLVFFCLFWFGKEFFVFVFPLPATCSSFFFSGRKSAADAMQYVKERRFYVYTLSRVYT